MTIASLYSDRIEESIQRQIRDPGPAPASQTFNAWSFLGAGAKGPMSGVLEAAGTRGDLLSFFSAPAAATFGAIDQVDPAGVEAARKKMLEGNSFDPEAGDALRRKADTWAPDPMTSSTADQTIHSLTRGLTKAAIDIATSGPVGGAVAFGVDEGNNTGQRARMEGIDTATATKLGVVSGVTNTVSALIPMGGATIAKTAGLVVAGGPSTFMAQEALSRKILAEAGYNEQAKLHDPLDPLGLALSTAIPGLFGAMHLRNLSKIKSISVPKESDIAAAVKLTPEEQAHSDAYERSAVNLQDLQAAIVREKRPDVKAILQQEFDTLSTSATKAVHDHVAPRAALDPDVVDAARVKVTNAALHENLPDFPEAHSEVMRASDEIAAGRFPDVELPPTVRSPDAVREAAQAYVADTRSGIPEPSQLATPRTPTVDEMQSLSRVEAVPLDKAVSFQATRKWNDFAAGKHPGEVIEGYGDKPVALRLESGEYIIQDGNHRTDLALRAGEKTMDMHVIDVKSYDPEVAGRKPARQATGDELDELMAALGAPTVRAPRAPRAPIRQAIEGRNALPRPDNITVEPAKPKGIAEPGKPQPPSAESQRVAALAESDPSLRVKLPGSDQTLSVEVALKRAKEEAAYEAGEADLLKAALDCALAFGA